MNDEVVFHRASWPSVFPLDGVDVVVRPYGATKTLSDAMIHACFFDEYEAVSDDGLDVRRLEVLVGTCVTNGHCGPVKRFITHRRTKPATHY